MPAVKGPASSWLRPLPLAVGGLVSIALLVWFLGPLLALGAERPLETRSARIALICVALVLWGAAQGWRRWKRWRADDALLRGLASGVDGDAAEARAPQPLSAWSGRLHALVGDSWFGADSAPWSRPSIAERPWYVLLGEAGGGKARTLAGLGQASKVERAVSNRTAAAGSSPTAAVRASGFDWWFFEQATVIDAAWIGSDRPLDEPAATTAWNRFFARVRSARGPRPIDGVIVTIDAADLLQHDSPAGAHRPALRDALAQVRTRARTGVPMVLLVTGIDRLEGFDAVSADIGPRERRRPFGFDLRPDGDPLAAAWSRFERTLADRRVERMEASSDPALRAAAFVFTQAFDSLRAPLLSFVASAVPDAGVHDGGLRLHGVYFAGTAGPADASGPGPLGPVSRALRREFGIEPTSTVVGVGPASRSFFLERLLGDVLLEEPGLQRRRHRARHRRAQWRLGGYAVLGVAATVLAVAWLASFTRNIGYVAEVRARPAELRRAIEALPPATDGDVTPLPSVLSAVRGMAAPGDFDVDHAPFLSGLGLYQGDKLDVAATIAYEHLLDHALMPRLVHRLEERLRAASGSDLEQAYDALKSYLMVYTPDRFDAEVLGAWIRADWDTSIAGRLGANQRAALDRHLEALLRRGAPKAVAPIDMALVDRARGMLAAYPLENRVYSRLKRANAGPGLPEFTLAAAGGPRAAAVFSRASGQPITRGIPGLYTREGYEKALQSSIETLILQLANEESWVLGIGASDGRGGVAGAVNAAEAAAKRAREIAAGQMSNRVRRLYFDDFLRQWDAYIADMRLVPLDSLDKARTVAQVLGGADSPLLSLTRAIARDTTLTPAASFAGRATAALSTALDQAAASRNEAARVSGVEPSASDAGASTGQMERSVDDHFSGLRRLAGGNGASIEPSLRLFDRVAAQIGDVDLAQRKRTPLPSPAGLTESRLAAAGQPEPIRTMLQSLASSGLAALGPVATGVPPGATRPARSP